MNKCYDSICCFRGSANPSGKRLLWEITTECNLSCSFCHRTQSIDYGPDISEIKEVIPILKEIGIKDIIISGGEPLQRTDIFNIIDLLILHGFNVDMCTNGTLITNSVAKELSRYLTEISVSIDSFIPSTHDLMRGSDGSFNATISGIRALKESNLSVHTISVVKSSTINEIKDTVKFLFEMGISSMAFIGHIPIGTGKNDLFSKDTQLLLKSIFSELRNAFHEVDINTKELIKDSTMRTCLAGENVFGLDVNLNLKPCILQGKFGGIDLKDKQNLPNDVLDKLHQIKKLVLNNNYTGQGICPGSRLINEL